MNKQLIFGVSLILLASCGSEDPKDLKTQSSKKGSPKIVVAAGKVEPEQEIVSISAPSGGIISAIYNADGETVQKGQVLLQLDDAIEQNKVQEIQAKVQTQRSQIAVEQTQLKEVEFNLANKNALLNKVKRLIQSGAESKQTMEDLETEISVLQVTRERMKAKIDLAEQQLNELNTQLKTAQTEAAKKQFKAPSNGVLLDMQLNEGESVNQYATYAEFAPEGNLIVRAEVDELFSSRIKNGQQVNIVYTGTDKVIATGTVVKVSPYLRKKSLFSERADDQEDRRVREIRIALNSSKSLIINSKVECIIKI